MYIALVNLFSFLNARVGQFVVRKELGGIAQEQSFPTCVKGRSLAAQSNPIHVTS